MAKRKQSYLQNLREFIRSDKTLQFILNSEYRHGALFEDKRGTNEPYINMNFRVAPKLADYDRAGLNEIVNKVAKAMYVVDRVPNNAVQYFQYDGDRLHLGAITCKDIIGELKSKTFQKMNYKITDAILLQELKKVQSIKQETNKCQDSLYRNITVVVFPEISMMKDPVWRGPEEWHTLSVYKSETNLSTKQMKRVYNAFSK